MRKTLYTLAFAAVTALGANAATVEPVYSWEWTAEGGASIDASGWQNSFDYTVGDDHATLKQGGPWITSMPAMSGSFTVSFDVRNLTQPNINWNSIICLYSNGTSSGNNNSLQLQFNTSGELYLYNEVGGATSFGGNTSGNINSGVKSSDLVGSTEWTNFTIVSDIENQVLSLYVNGEEVGSVEEWNPASPALTGTQFGTAFGSGGHSLAGEMDVNNIKFYNQVVLPVPEPATASLSLLGLAALMMRRRRA